MLTVTTAPVELYVIHTLSDSTNNVNNGVAREWHECTTDGVYKLQIQSTK